MIINTGNLLELNLLLLLLKIPLEHCYRVGINEYFFDKVMSRDPQALSFEACTACSVGWQSLTSNEALLTKDLASTKEKELHHFSCFRLVCDGLGFRELGKLWIKHWPQSVVCFLTSKVLDDRLIDVLVLHDHGARRLKLTASHNEDLVIRDALFE